MCIAGGVAYAYFCTDLFKSNKQKFFKYFAKNIENMATLENKELTNYLEKKQNQAYENSGEFYANIDENTAKYFMSNDIYDEVKKFKITFEGQKDLPNNYYKDTINLQYSNGEKLTFQLAKQDDYYGLMVDKILKKYLTIENNNLKQFAKKLGVEDTSNIPDKIEIKDYSKYKFTDKEWENIKTKIYTTLNENLDNSMFKEEKGKDSDKFTLTLTEKQASSIILKMFDAIMNDETIIGKVKEFMINELEVNAIQADRKIEELKKNLKEKLASEEIIKNDEIGSSDEQKTFNISVYKYYNKSQAGVNIIFDEIKIDLITRESNIMFWLNKHIEEKEYIDYTSIMSGSMGQDKKDGKNTVFLDLEFNDETKFSIAMHYEGIDKENPKEEAAISFIIENEDNTESYEPLSFEYRYTNNINFKNNISKENLKENSVILNNYDSEKLMTTFQKLGERIAELNKTQMKSLGLEEDENPIIYINPIFAFSRYVYNYATSAIANDWMEDNNIINRASEAKELTNLSTAKEYISLGIIEMHTNYLSDKVKNTSTNISVDEYIENQICNTSWMDDLNDEIEQYNFYISEYDKNSKKLILTSETTNKKYIGKLENGKITWEE